MGKSYMISDILACKQDVSEAVDGSDLRDVEKSIMKSFLMKAILEIMDFRQEEIDCRCA